MTENNENKTTETATTATNPTPKKSGNKVLIIILSIIGVIILIVGIVGFFVVKSIADFANTASTEIQKEIKNGELQNTITGNSTQSNGLGINLPNLGQDNSQSDSKTGIIGSRTAKLPDNFPVQEVPIYQGLVLNASSSSKESGKQVFYVTGTIQNEGPDKVFQFYKETLAKNGFELTTETTFFGQQATYTKGERVVNVIAVSLDEEGKTTSVTITVNG